MTIHDKPTACALSSLIRSRTRTPSLASVAQHIFERLFQSIGQERKWAEKKKEQKHASEDGMASCKENHAACSSMEEQVKKLWDI